MNNAIPIEPYKYLVLYIKDGQPIFHTTRLSIAVFEELIEQRVLRYWELDEQTGVKRDANKH